MIPRAELWIPRLVPQRWLRGPSKLVHGRIELDRVAAEEYEVPDGPGALIDLLRVKTVTDTAWFVERHGLLRHGPAEANLAEAWTEWTVTRDGLANTLVWAGAAARAGAGDRLALIGLAGILEPFATDPTFKKYIGDLSVEDAMLPDRLMGLAAAALTGGFIGSELSIRPMDVRLGYAFSVSATTLAQRLWFEAALFLTGRTLMSRCAAPDCGRWFEQDDPRRRFCSDTCSARTRGARARARRSRGDPRG